MENYLGERLVADALPQHDPTVQCYLGCFVPSHRDSFCVTSSGVIRPCTVCTVWTIPFVSPFQQYKEDLLVGTEVFNSGAPRPNLPPQDVVKDLTHVLLPLETHTITN